MTYYIKIPVVVLVSLLFAFLNSKYVTHKNTHPIPDSIRIHKKIDSLINVLNKKIYPFAVDEYKLLDINYDGQKDLILCYHGVGTGNRSLINVYLYDSLSSNFIENENLIQVQNPSFYLDKKIITGYYIGSGGGDAVILKWTGVKWDIWKSFDIEPAIYKRETGWKITQHFNAKDSVFYKGFFVEPDSSIFPNY